MQALETQFEEGRYRYRQLEREGDVAIFEQQHKENPKVIRYEVVRIRVQPAHAWPDGRTTPEREAYPGSSTWGTLGFTTYTRAEAETIAARMRGSQTVDPETQEPTP